MATGAPGQTAIIGGQTVRLASSPAGTSAGTLLKAGTAIASPGGKQIILQKQGLTGGAGQPQIVTLVKTSQGMQVATVPKASIVQGGKPGATQHIVQTGPGKTIPQGATIVKLVNAPGGGAAGSAKIVTNVKGLGGSNVMTVAKPGGGTVQMATGASPAGKQTFVINKPAGTVLRGPGGQQIVVVSTGGTMKTVQALTTSQAGGTTMTTSGGQRLMVVSSSQLASGTASTTNRPITISVPGQAGGAAKTVTLAGTPGGARLATGATQLLNTSTGQILTVPAGAAGGTQSVNIGGKQVNVQMAATTASGGAGKTLTLVQAGSGAQTADGQKMIVVQAVSLSTYLHYKVSRHTFTLQNSDHQIMRHFFPRLHYQFG